MEANIISCFQLKLERTAGLKRVTAALLENWQKVAAISFLTNQLDVTMHNAKPAPYSPQQLWGWESRGAGGRTIRPPQPKGEMATVT